MLNTTLYVPGVGVFRSRSRSSKIIIILSGIDLGISNKSGAREEMKTYFSIKVFSSRNWSSFEGMWFLVNFRGTEHFKTHDYWVSYPQDQVMKEENATICGLPGWTALTRNETVSFINNVLLAAVNAPCAIFAFLCNLAVIVTVTKNPSLQRPCSILLCSLACTDFLTAVIAQPMFVVWRLILPNAKESCSHQLWIFYTFHNFYAFTVGLSFVIVIIMSFDRHYALSKPLIYNTEASKEGRCLHW